ncbi:leucine-rich receptor-like protein kinase family protein [Actinidia rufa]|uniref:non-specific serine/threonine protein kinase n=1 Tax=Actinidia rufa TaxID=165716 RepID=A0A7J0G0A2_9ERIC|nr:leucine-rich receptor-like protein kinase family protein [Actinidia rufa]
MLLTLFQSCSPHTNLNPSSGCFFLILVLSISCFFPNLTHASCNAIDRDSLLSLSLSTSVPLNWSSGLNCCIWEGILCDGNHRVSRLWLPFRGLRGTISPSILNLTSLSQLNLSHNSLYGPIPDGFFASLNRIQIIDLSYNRLSGQLPSSDILPVSIQTVDLSGNHLNGTIQSLFFQSASNLAAFDVSNNSFTGPMPSSICVNSPSIKFLDFSINDFSGEIPQGFWGCLELEVFRAGFNLLSGKLPSDIYNAGALQQISLPANNFIGQIDGRIVSLTNLRVIELFGNRLNGTIPVDIGALSNLEQLHLYINNLTGTLPPTLDLGNNNFTGSLPVSLFSCISLTAIRLASNQLEGQILPDIVALQSLSFLSLSTNNLINFTGAIRILVGCRNLSALIISKNFYNEALPGDENIVDSEGFQKLQVLALGGCNFTGQIPSWLAKLGKLEVLDLSYNHITGLIPGLFGSLPNLFYLDLSYNLLSGEFPKELTQLPGLVSEEAADQIDRSYLELPVFVQPNNVSYLQYNQLSNLPPAIYLTNNSLSGHIPVEIGQLKDIHVLDLSMNNFSGNIPDQLSNLTNLEKLDLSGNHLSGEIPPSLSRLHFLSWFSIADNNLQGPIPTGGQFDTFPISSFERNQGLCGALLHHPCSTQPDSPRPSASDKSRKKKIIIGLILGICFGVGFTLTMLTLWILSKRRILPRGDSDKVDIETISFNSNSGISTEFIKDASLVIVFPNNTDDIKNLTITEILKATDNFNQANIIGCGGFGLVYKATLENGTKLAVKKLSGDMGLMEREFKAEVEALSTAQHKNLVSLQGYCVHDGCRLLMYSYMENGSLDYWLHEKPDGKRPMELFKPKMSRELVVWVQQMRNEGKQDEVFDPLLRGKGFEEEMRQLLDVACMCVNQNHLKRPTITEVVNWLQNIGANGQPPK